MATATPSTSLHAPQSSQYDVELKKVHGRAFYESIGSPKFILAPMVSFFFPPVYIKDTKLLSQVAQSEFVSRLARLQT